MSFPKRRCHKPAIAVRRMPSRLLNTMPGKADIPNAQHISNLPVEFHLAPLEKAPLQDPTRRVPVPPRDPILRRGPTQHDPARPRDPTQHGLTRLGPTRPGPTRLEIIWDDLNSSDTRTMENSSPLARNFLKQKLSAMAPSGIKRGSSCQNVHIHALERVQLNTMTGILIVKTGQLGSQPLQTEFLVWGRWLEQLLHCRKCQQQSGLTVLPGGLGGDQQHAQLRSPWSKI